MSAVSDLAAKLYDPTNQFWSASELTAYIVEALRTWNSLTSFWRSELTFPLSSGTWWYDLTVQAGSLRLYTVTDNDLLLQMEYHLLEPLTASYPLTWTGSNQFALTDLLETIGRRRDETLSTTGCTLTRSLVNAGPVIRTLLADNVIDIRRVEWIPNTGLGFTNATLRPSDDWAEQSFDPSYTVATGRPPMTYRRSVQPPLSFDVDVVPPVAGQYEVLSVNAGPALVTTVATLLGVPDDWSWVIKWGSLADVLSEEANAKDALRAQYCEKRYEEGLALLNDAAALLAVRLNDVPLPVDAARNGDDYDPLWQSAAPGTPTAAYVAGLNLAAFGPAPDAGPWSVTASVVRNAPIPTVPGDFIQLGRDDYEVVLDYAQHLAAFKMGGAEFEATMPLYQGFLKRAALYNSKLTSLGTFQKPIYEISQLEEERNPRYSAVTPASGGTNG